MLQILPLGGENRVSDASEMIYQTHVKYLGTYAFPLKVPLIRGEECYTENIHTRGSSHGDLIPLVLIL